MSADRWLLTDLRRASRVTAAGAPGRERWTRNMQSTMLMTALGALAFVPTCWLPALHESVSTADHQSAGIVRQSGISHLAYLQADPASGAALVYVQTSAQGRVREVITDSDDASAFQQPALVITSDDVVVAVWGCPAGVCIARREAGGRWLHMPDARGDAPSLLAASPTNDGGLHVVWQSSENRSVIRYRRLSSRGWQPAQTVVRVSPDNAAICDDLGVTDVGGSPSVVVACEEPGAVWYAHLDDRGWRTTLVHEGSSKASRIAARDPGNMAGATQEHVIWCADDEVGVSTIVRSKPDAVEAPVTHHFGAAACAPGSAAIASGKDGTMHAVFAGPIYYTDRGPPRRPLLYAQLVGDESGWTEANVFCIGRAPNPLRHVAVSGDGSGVSVSWESPAGPLGSRVNWTQGVTGPMATLCSTD